MLSETEENISRIEVVSQKDSGDGLGPLTTAIPMTAKLNILFGDKSVGIIKQYTLTYILSDCSVLWIHRLSRSQCPFQHT